MPTFSGRVMNSLFIVVSVQDDKLSIDDWTPCRKCGWSLLRSGLHRCANRRRKGSCDASPALHMPVADAACRACPWRAQGDEKAPTWVIEAVRYLKTVHRNTAMRRRVLVGLRSRRCVARRAVARCSALGGSFLWRICRGLAQALLDVCAGASRVPAPAVLIEQ